MIFYTVDDDINREFYEAPKRTRQVFCFKDGILLQSRMYPKTDDEDTRCTYRNIVQRAIADCLGTPNLWSLKRDQEDVGRYVGTHHDALHYPDYQYKEFKANVSLLKGEDIDESKKIIVGYTALCIECADDIGDNNSLYCGCHGNDGYVTCYECDSRVDEDDAHEIDGEWYCEDCCDYCDSCNEYFTEERTEAYDRRGNIIGICSTCRDNDFFYCEDCDNYFNEERGESLDDGFHCNECLNENYYTCHSCDEYVRCDDAEEIDGEYYCESCAEDIRADMEESA